MTAAVLMCTIKTNKLVIVTDNKGNAQLFDRPKNSGMNETRAIVWQTKLLA